METSWIQPCAPISIMDIFIVYNFLRPSKAIESRRIAQWVPSLPVVHYPMKMRHNRTLTPKCVKGKHVCDTSPVTLLPAEFITPTQISKHFKTRTTPGAVMSNCQSPYPAPGERSVGGVGGEGGEEGGGRRGEGGGRGGLVVVVGTGGYCQSRGEGGGGYSV